MQLQPIMKILNFLSTPPMVYFTIVWAIIWKGWGAWAAAKRNHKIWFWAFIILNTLGFLEIFYLFILPTLTKKKTKKENNNSEPNNESPENSKSNL